MKSITCNLLGRLGNQLFCYAYLRAYAEQNGLEVHTQPWIGQQIFQIDDPPLDGSEEVLPEAYHQDQASLIYSRADCRRWFEFRPEVIEQYGCGLYDPVIVAHYRCGDYLGLGYPVVSKTSISLFVARNNVPHRDLRLHIVSEESGNPWIGDFYAMTRAKILIRSNSSFSWWAATLGNGRVFSPVIEGLKGGMEHDTVPFVEGNHPRFCELEFVTDLYLRDN